MIKIGLLLICSYLLGSIPNGYLLVRLLKGEDIRNFGSGNIGATNVARVLGKRWGFFVLFLDIMKGFLAVTLLPKILALSEVEIIKLGSGVIAVAGHNWPMFLEFRGGKGVATSAGVLIGLVPSTFLSVLLIWILVFTITRYVSLSSIIAGISLPIFLVLYGNSLTFIIFGILIAAVGVWKHRANIKRLIHGKEPKFILK